MGATVIDAFLCHNKTDKDWVTRLAADIETETIDGLNTSRRLAVFLDEWDIDVGENVVNHINSGLGSARNVIVVMSPEFFESGWTNFEWTDIVAEDPWGTKKKLIPVLLRDLSLDGSRRINVPAPFKALKYFDFRDPRKFNDQLEKLLKRVRGLPPARGQRRVSHSSPGFVSLVEEEERDSWAPSQVRDLLLSNLLQVVSFPSAIWSGETDLRTSKEVRDGLPDAEGHIIRAKRLWTFTDLSIESCELRKVIDTESIEKQSSGDWIANEQKQDWWIALINQALTSYLSKLAIKKESKGRFFFRPKDGTTRVWQNGKDRPRTVAAMKTNSATGSTFWVHHAARIKFRKLGNRFFLQIEPTYLFTSDGEKSLGGQQMGRMVFMWSGKQRNPDVLRNFAFWAKTIAMSKSRIEIKTGGESIIISSIPALAVSRFGVETDHIRIGSLLKENDTDLDDAAREVEVVRPEDIEEDGDETEEE